MKYIKTYENIFHNSSLYSIYNEDFWQQVVANVGKILGTKTGVELSMELDDEENFIEFGIDIGNNVYNLNFDFYEDGTADFRASRYPQGDGEIELKEIRVDKGPQIIAAFLATVLS